MVVVVLYGRRQSIGIDGGGILTGGVKEQKAGGLTDLKRERERYICVWENLTIGTYSLTQVHFGL